MHMRVHGTFPRDELLDSVLCSSLDSRGCDILCQLIATSLCDTLICLEESF